MRDTISLIIGCILGYIIGCILRYMTTGIMTMKTALIIWFIVCSLLIVSMWYGKDYTE